MELKIKVNTITIKDDSAGEEHTIQTVQSVSEILELVNEMEREALEVKVCDLVSEY